MKQSLRHYQCDAHTAVFDALMEDWKRILYTSATGTGKTTIIAEICFTFLHEYHYKILAIAHRKEIVSQIYKRVRDHNGLADKFDIGKEEAKDRAGATCQVIAGNVNTVRNANRLPSGWTPDVIIIDEAHRAAARSYRLIMDRFPDAIVIGTTATAKRTDKQALYAVRPDGSPVLIYDKEIKGDRPAKDTETVFQFHCFEYSLTEAVEDGWLVPTRGDIVKTDVDISNVGTSMNAEGEVDFVQSQLVAELEKDVEAIKHRVQLAYEGWKLKMTDRPTIAFWPGVQTAKIANLYWRDQGHASDELNGESDNEDAGKRQRVIEDFNCGAVKVLHNVGLFVEGIDIPICSGIIAAAPTKSWNKYVQQVGRGGRSVIGDALNEIPTAEERREAISVSAKPDCYVLRLIDVANGMELCDLPAILDLPVSFDLQGHTVNEAKKLMDEYEQDKAQVIAECPFSYEQLKVRLEQLDLMRRSKSKTMDSWRVTERGYTFVRVPVGFTAEIVAVGEQWNTVVSHMGREIARKPGPLRTTRTESFKAYQDTAARQVSEIVSEHSKTTPKRSLGTLAWIQGWNGGGKSTIRHLLKMGFSNEAIDALGKQQVFAIMRPVWAARQGGQEAA